MKYFRSGYALALADSNPDSCSILQCSLVLQLKNTPLFADAIPPQDPMRGVLLSEIIMYLTHTVYAFPVGFDSTKTCL